MLGDGYEFRRWYDAAFGMIPAHQRLDTHHAPAVGRKLGLEVYNQLFVRESAREFALNLAAPMQRVLITRIEHSKRAPAFGARAIQRNVRAAKKRFGIVAVLRGDRYADRGCDTQYMIARRRLLAQAFQDVT